MLGWTRRGGDWHWAGGPGKGRGAWGLGLSLPDLVMDVRKVDRPNCDGRRHNMHTTRLGIPTSVLASMDMHAKYQPVYDILSTYSST